MLRTVYIPSVIALALLVACDSQVDEDYQGEPFASLSGNIVNERSAPLPDSIEVGILWYAQDGERRGLQSEAAAISGAFPAAYTLDVHEPPPPGANNIGASLFLNLDCEGEECPPSLPDDVAGQLRKEFDALSVGGLLLAESGAFAALGDVYWSDSEEETPEDLEAQANLDGFAESVLGGAKGTVLYVHQAFSAESYVGRAYGRALSPGFYLETIRLEDTDFDVFACKDEAGDDALARLDCELQDHAATIVLLESHEINLVLVDDPEEVLEYFLD